MVRLPSSRPRVSRETRLLFITIGCAVAALWVLGRVRFPERASTSPVPAMLAPLASPASFGDLATAVARVSHTASPRLTTVAVAADATSGRGSREVATLPIGDALGVALVDADPGAAGVSIAPPAALVAFDPVTTLAVVRLALPAAPAFEPWTAERLDEPQYLITSEGGGAQLSWRPVFVGRLSPEHSARWNGMVWTPPSSAAFAPGEFVFTTDGEFVGLTTPHRGRVSIVPFDTLSARANALVRAEGGEPATLGVAVSALTPAVAAATGAPHGVVIAHIDPGGPAASRLEVADVIVTVGTSRVMDLDEWDAARNRLVVGQAVEVHVQRRGSAATMVVVPAAPTVSVASDVGLELRRVAGEGAAVTGVRPGTAGARAGLVVGDTITWFGGVVNPTPSQITRRWAVAPHDRPLVTVVARGDTYRVLSLER